jgi:hypothetical protein
MHEHDRHIPTTQRRERRRGRARNGHAVDGKVADVPALESKLIAGRSRPRDDAFDHNAGNARHAIAGVADDDVAPAARATRSRGFLRPPVRGGLA